MSRYLQILRDEKLITTAIVGTLAFSFILVTTLSLTLAFMSLVIFLSLIIFQKSFHYGLVFFLGVILIFPPRYVIDGMLTTEEAFIIILALVGLVNLVVERYKLKIYPLFYYWLGLALFSVGVLFLSGDYETMLATTKRAIIKQLIVAFAVYPIIVISFQHFFQTARRLERFFSLVVLVGSVQAILSILILAGIIGDGYLLNVEEYAFSMLWAITIPVTLGMWLIQKSSLSTLEFGWLEKRRNNIHQFVDSILMGGSRSAKEGVVNLKRARVNKQVFFVVLLLLQGCALILVSSYVLLIIVGLGIFIMGVLMRHSKISWVISGILLFFIVLLPSNNTVLIGESKQEILDFLVMFKQSCDWSVLWHGFDVQQHKQVNSAYLVIFDRLGFIGLTVFVAGLIQYFKEIRNAYLKSDEAERIWLVVILAIFVEFVLLGILSNAFFAWPAALLFWLMYGALQNLKRVKKEYGLTETVINKL